jgi:hypothetical protein
MGRWLEKISKTTADHTDKTDTTAADGVSSVHESNRRGFVGFVSTASGAFAENPTPPNVAAWWPKPYPDIRREPPFGSDDVPARFRSAWQALLAQCPPAVRPFVWEAAIYDAALLFSDFGSLLDNYRWLPGDLFDLPGGLIWFIKGSPVVAIGRSMAQCLDGRIWKKAVP